jgi:hypothetical protein
MFALHDICAVRHLVHLPSPRRHPQMVLDVSNMRPVMGLLLLGCCLGAIAYFSHGIAAQDAAALRRQVYARKGSFVPEVGMRDAPQDVRRKSFVALNRQEGSDSGRAQRNTGDRRASTCGAATDEDMCVALVIFAHPQLIPAWKPPSLHTTTVSVFHTPSPARCPLAPYP